MPIMWCLANPKLGEREVVAALLDANHHLIRGGRCCWPTRAWRARRSNGIPNACSSGPAPVGHGRGHLNNWLTSVASKRSLIAYDH
jgi:hypothetical protein